MNKKKNTRRVVEGDSVQANISQEVQFLWKLVWQGGSHGVDMYCRLRRWLPALENIADLEYELGITSAFD